MITIHRFRIPCLASGALGGGLAEILEARRPDKRPHQQHYGQRGGHSNSPRTIDEACQNEDNDEERERKISPYHATGSH
ncbi:hypothetical protein RJ55_04083 [Drechmeria coniospora]|nr:hypothetical protein RJ55_04083 [Drechmeria coniospora]